MIDQNKVLLKDREVIEGFLKKPTSEWDDLSPLDSLHYETALSWNKPLVYVQIRLDRGEKKLIETLSKPIQSPEITKKMAYSMAGRILKKREIMLVDSFVIRQQKLLGLMASRLTKKLLILPLKQIEKRIRERAKSEREVMNEIYEIKYAFSPVTLLNRYLSSLGYFKNYSKIEELLFSNKEDFDLFVFYEKGHDDIKEIIDQNLDKAEMVGVKYTPQERREIITQRLFDRFQQEFIDELQDDEIDS